jgi:hypothetical protein
MAFSPSLSKRYQAIFRKVELTAIKNRIFKNTVWNMFRNFSLLCLTLKQIFNFKNLFAATSGHSTFALIWMNKLSLFSFEEKDIKPTFIFSQIFSSTIFIAKFPCRAFIPQHRFSNLCFSRFYTNTVKDTKPRPSQGTFSYNSQSQV